MSAIDPSNPVRDLATQDPNAPVQQTPTAATTLAVSGGGGSGGAGSQNISSMDDLKNKQPKLYKLMLEGIGTTIVNEMKDHQDKIKEMNRKARSDSERH